MLLIAPAPPLAPMPVKRVAAASAVKPVALASQLLAPNRIPTRISTVAEMAPPSSDLASSVEGVPGGTSTSNIGELLSGAGPVARPMVRAAAQKKMAISSGVMAGNKIPGPSPAYPLIAKAARIEGTVVLAATISKAGTIENLHVASGPPMLVAGALEAVKAWRYKPYLLNGQPVEVETTINVVFSLAQ